MNDQQRILVIGATGGQGGSVARHLLSSGNYSVRCLTRNPDSPAAKRLQQSGAEIIQGDLDDIDSLHTAMEGCQGVYGVTNFWEHFDREYQQGKNLIDAVGVSEVKHFVFSTLPSVNDLADGTLEVPHFEMKARLEKYTRELGLPATIVHIAFYYENFLSFFPPQLQDDGSYAFGFPQGDTPLAAVSVEDVGGVVAVIFENPDEYLGKLVGIVGDDLQSSSYADIMSQEFGKNVKYNYIPREVFASFDFPGAEDLANMFEFNRLYISDRKQDLQVSRFMFPEIKPFNTWLHENREKFSSVFK